MPTVSGSMSSLTAPPQLVVAIPTSAGRAVSIFWAIHLRKLPLPIGTHVLARTDYAVDANRNALVRAALTIPGATHLLFLDDDIWPPLEGAQQLLAYREPIVSGVYLDKQRRSMLADFVQEGDALRIRRVELPGPNQHVRVDMTGLGFCLIDLAVFRRLDPPWFVYRPELGEDAYFFRRVQQELGIRPLATGAVACQHEQPGLIQPESGDMVPVALVRMGGTEHAHRDHRRQRD